MSVLIELTSEEVKVLAAIMNKVRTPTISTSITPPKKLSKLEITRQSIKEAWARKEARKKRNL